MDELIPQDTPPPSGEFLLYTSADGKVKLDIRLQDETLWMTQQMMAELFQTSVHNIIQHVGNIYEDGELQREGTCKDFLQVRQEGKRKVKRSLTFYNLDMVISVGYRVNSVRGTQFRIWATQRLREYLIKGFAIDDERLKNPPVPGATPLPDYFDELLERIRDIRSSERRMYLRIRDIFAMAADYLPDAAETNAFFATMQNKLHFAITGHTAAELIMLRAQAEEPNMGLTSCAKERVHSCDVTIAKNYLREEEIANFNRLTSMVLDFVEDQARNRKEIFMEQWEELINNLLTLMGRKVLRDKGSLTMRQAHTYAREQYRLFGERRRLSEEQVAAENYLRELEAGIKLLEDGKNNSSKA